MISTTLSGGFMFAVHVFSPWLPASEYGLFTTLLSMVGLMMIPALGLQSTLAHQTAAAVTEEQEADLVATVRTLMRWSFLLWAVISVLVLIWSPRLVSDLKIRNANALIVTLLIALPQFWLPVLLGVLQGRQNFPWLGLAGVSNGLGRFLAIAVIVTVLGGHATGAMAGVLAGFVLSLVLAVWQGREIFTLNPGKFDWRAWLSRVWPLTLGLGASQFMLIADMLVVRRVFDADATGPYGAAGMIGRGLVQFTAPLTAVMFPKLVRSVARAETTLVLEQTLKATAFLGVLAASGCTIAALLAPGFLEFIQNSDVALLKGLGGKLIPHEARLIAVAKLIPWFAWAMLPLALANVLITNLLARGGHKAILWMVLIAATYAVTIWLYHPSFTSVILSLGVSNIVLFCACWYFSKLESKGH